MKDDSRLAVSGLGPSPMPHNWASAECVLFLRHMLALEDGQALRLLAGIGSPELSADKPLNLTESPTRFGRINLHLELLDGRQGWRLQYTRGAGPSPERVVLPSLLGLQFKFVEVKGAPSHREGNAILVAPEAASWVATWKA